MVQQVEVLSTKIDDLSSIPWTPMVGRRTNTYKILLIHKSVVASLPPSLPLSLSISKQTNKYKIKAAVVACTRPSQ